MQQFQGFRPGDVVDGRYQIIEEIGRGGFGVVYTARQMAIDRIVALKILLPEADTVDPQAVERFRREAVLISSLESPNTITLIEFGQTDRGALYTVMEYARGDTLRDILAKAGKLDPQRAVRIINQVCLSLHEAHQRGIVHRDLKPANIMVGEFAGQTDHVKVLDFGIAKILKSGDTQSTLALTGRIVGTPRYMAPEQLRGANPTPSCDLYALGLIFFEMLTGSPAITVTDAMAQVEAQMKKDNFRLPQLPGVPLNLVTTVNKALEKDPSRRYQSAQVFRKDLEAAISGRAVQGDPNKTKVRTAADGPVHFHSRGGPPTAEYHDAEEGGGLGAFLIAAVVLFMLALGGVAFLLFTGDEGTTETGSASSGEESSEAGGETTTTNDGQDGQGTDEAATNGEGTTPEEGARRPLPMPRNTTGVGLDEDGQGSAEGDGTSPDGTSPDGAGGDGATAANNSEGDDGGGGTANDGNGSATDDGGSADDEDDGDDDDDTVAAADDDGDDEEDEDDEEVAAAPSTVEIEIVVDPDDASIYVEGDRVCRSSPCTVEVPGDGSSVSLMVRERGYDTERRSIDSDDAPRLDIELDEEPEEEEEEEETGGGGLVPL